MKLTKCELPKRRFDNRYCSNFLILDEFLESGYGCAEVTEYSQKKPHTAATSLRQSIKRREDYKFIKAFCIDNKVYLMHTLRCDKGVSNDD